MDTKRKDQKQPKGLRIAYVALDVSPQLFRGSSTHTIEIAKKLVSLGNEIHLICRRQSKIEPKFEISDRFFIHRFYRGIIVPIKPRPDFEEVLGEEDIIRRSFIRSFIIKLYKFYLKYVFSLYFAIIIAKIVKKYNIDIILERGSSLGAGAIACIISRRPMVSEIIGTNFKRISLKVARKIIAYSYEIIPKEYIDKTHLITAAANIEMFTPEIDGTKVRKKYGIENVLVIGFSGSFADWHGALDLVKASKKVISKIGCVRFFMIGPNAHIKASPLVSKMNIEDYFIFTGPIPYDKVPSYLRACDILVAPYNPNKYAETRIFGFFYSPIKIFEYMACGRPIVASSCGNIPSILRDKITGHLFEPGNVNGLADAILYFLENREILGEIGKNARKDVETRYSWKYVARKIEWLLKMSIKQ